MAPSALNASYRGLQAPDIVLALDVAQGWGTAHLAGVAHYVNMIDVLGNSMDNWGWAIDGGLKFNLPTIGAGDVFEIQGE